MSEFRYFPMRLKYGLIFCLLVTSLASGHSVAQPPENKKNNGKTDKTQGFQLVARDNFDQNSDGWLPESNRATCATNDYQLGVAGIYGNNKIDPISKSFSIEQKHTHVRVQASISFLDNWMGQSATLKVDGNVAWTQDWHHCSKVFGELCSGVTVCGDGFIADKVGQKIDVILPHTDNTVTLELSTDIQSLDVGASLLIDDIQISIF